MRAGIMTTTRKTRGDDIDAAVVSLVGGYRTAVGGTAVVRTCLEWKTVKTATIYLVSGAADGLFNCLLVVALRQGDPGCRL